MQDESCSSNVVEQGGDNFYQCAHCPKVFKCGRARGGHQNAHRQRPVLRTYKGKKLSDLHPVLATVLSHHVPDNSDELITSNMPKIDARVGGSSTQQENNVVQSKSKTNKRSSSSQCYSNKKPQRVFHTVDFLTGWTWNVEDRMASPSTGTPSEETTMDLMTKVLMDKGDDLNLELQLRAGNPNKPDLELKL